MPKWVNLTFNNQAVGEMSSILHLIFELATSKVKMSLYIALLLAVQKFLSTYLSFANVIVLTCTLYLDYTPDNCLISTLVFSGALANLM